MSNLSLFLSATLAALPLISGALTTKKSLNLAAIKTMIAAAEAEAKKHNVDVTFCVVDESGNLLFLQKGDKVGVNTLNYAQKKARYAAAYGKPSKNSQDSLAKGNLAQLVMPEAFPNQGGVPIIVDGQVIGGISASGAPSEIDEAIAQAGVDALLEWLKR